MKNPTAALAAGAAIVTIALTAAAFWLSYEHLHDIAGSNGLDGARAWAWPATVDLFIITGELLVLRASLRATVDGWAYALAAVGSLGSIALNVFGVGDHAQPMEYVVAAVPPSAALIAFGALMRQVHEALDRIQVGAPASASAAFDQAASEATALASTAVPHPDAPASQLPVPPDARPALPAADAHPVADTEPDPAQAGRTEPSPDADAHPAAPAASATGTASDDELIEQALALQATGPLSLRRMQRELGIGQTRAQRIRDALAAAS